MLNPLRKFATSAACNCNTITSPIRPSCKNLRIHARCVGVESLLDGRGHAALVVMQSHCPAVLFEIVGGISHDHRMSGKGQHLDVIVVVADGHYLGTVETAAFGPTLQCVPFGAAGVEDINDTQVACLILRTQ